MSDFGWLIDNMIEAHAAMNRCERYEFASLREDYRKERKALEDAIAARSSPPIEIPVEVSLGVIEHQALTACLGAVPAEGRLEIVELVAAQGI